MTSLVPHRPALLTDRAVPALLVKVGHYPQHHGGLGVVRTLGRLGVAVHAVVESRLTPVACSRYLAGGLRWGATGTEEAAPLVEGLLTLGRAIGARSVPVPTDDEAAVLLAENAERLSECFLLPSVPSNLPRRLASKHDLYRICTESGTPSPRARAPRDRDALVAAGRELGYPIVLKNLEPWSRVRTPAVGNTTRIDSEVELLDRFGGSAPPPVLVQEYIPREQAEDWIVHLYCPEDGADPLVFTGLKLRSWPPHAGVTTRAVARPNPPLAALATDLCAQVGYRGPADLDWRYDRRDRTYKLLDFNPRTGAQFRLFENGHGVDVVRALHLDLTGNEIPRGRQAEGRVFVAGQLDLPSAVVASWERRRVVSGVLPGRARERAWLCCDDPLPAAVESAFFAGAVAQRAVRALRRAWRRTMPVSP